MIETVKMDGDKFRLSCSLYELLEIWSMRKTELEIVYIDENQKEVLHKGIITNIYSRKGLEQVVIDEKLVILTRNLIKVNDVGFSNYLT